jgi:ASC-1-like (ASCH) protein
MLKVTTHDLKTVDRYYDAVADGRKTFEVRLNDRAFQTGDIVRLRKINEVIAARLTGRRDRDG